MIRCMYCKEKWFKSRQALRAHLRFCPAYQEAKIKAGIKGKYLQAIPDGHTLRYDNKANPDALWRDYIDSM